MNKILQKARETAKMLAALAGALAVALVGMIPDEWGKYLQIAAAILTAVATYLVPNAAPLDPDVDTGPDAPAGD